MGFAASQARLIVLTQRKSDLEMRMMQISNSEMMLAMQSEEVANEYSRKLSNRTVVFNDGTDSGSTQSIAQALSDMKGLGYRLYDADGHEVEDLGGYTKYVLEQDGENAIIDTVRDAVKLKINRGPGSMYGDTEDAPAGVTADMVKDDKNYVVDKDGNVKHYKHSEGDMNRAINLAVENIMSAIRQKGYNPDRNPAENTYKNEEYGIEINLGDYYTAKLVSSDARGQEIANNILNGTWKIYQGNKADDDSNLVNVGSNTNFIERYYTEDDAEAEAEYNAATARIHAKEKRLQTEMVQVQSQQKACETEIESVKKLIEKNTEQMFKYYN